MRFVCLPYLDEPRWAGLSQPAQTSLLARYREFHDRLRADGHLLAALGLRPDKTTLGVAPHPPQADRRNLVQLPAGGVLVLQAESAARAVALMSMHPAMSIGPIDVYCVDEELTAAATADITSAG